jgi:hypothetical protein
VGSLADIFAEVKLDLTKQEEGRFRRKIANIDTKNEGAKVATRFGVGFNGAIGGIVSKSAGVFAAGFAAVQGVKVFGGFINDARESAKVGRLTAQVVKSTGGAAKVTAEQVGDLATAISNKTGADDEAIQSGQNLLLTFTNIRNGVGKGNDIFNQASQAATDMAAAMNGGEVTADGLKTSSIQLGKALNDPIKGVSALSKVGVSFTADQKKQIKTLVDSGKTMEAQKIILGELGKEFGGAAQAAADPMTRLKTIGGNLSETIGGLLLPSVNKFVTFVTNTGIPGVEGLISAFQGEGVTSDGFVGFMERVGVTARKVFDYFKSDVLPRLRDFGGFIGSEVVPRLKDFGSFLGSEVVPRVRDFAGFLISNAVPAISNLADAVKPLAQDIGAAVVGGFQKLLPILQSVGQFIGGTIVPAVVDFTKWLKENSTVVGAVAVGIGAILAALQVYKATLAVVSFATKAYTAVQAALNVVLALNPIGIVVLALVGLAAGLVYAYKKSEKFRDIVNGVWKAVSGAAQTAFKAVVGFVKGAIDWVKTNWPLLLAILTGPIGLAVYAISKHWEAIKSGARTAIAFVVDKFLGLVETMVTGASKAFGWVPGIGPKLKTAAAEFKKFRDDVNAKLSGISDQTVKITPQFSSTATMVVGGVKRSVPLNVIGSAGRGMKDGGGVFGGERGKDSVPALLMPDEHVWTTKEVQAAGGHGAMYRMRKAALAGELRGFARGGSPTRFNVQSGFPNTTRFAREVASHAVLLAKPVAQQLANQWASTVAVPGGPPGARKSFRGVTLNQRTIGMLLNAERILGAMFHITQGSYSTRVAASGSTHAGGGAMDTNGPRGWNTAVAALRKAGFAAWHRTPAQGPWNHHIHSIAIGDPTASAAAKAQVRSFLRGGDGLGGMAMGGRVLLRDRGGPLPHGMFAYNNSGKTETVVPGGGVMTVELSREDRRRLDRIAARPVVLNGRLVDEAMTRDSLGRG